MSRRDDFNAPIKTVLAHRAGYMCSKPDCRALTAGPAQINEKRVNLGVAAHITAAAPGGPRYDSELSSVERKSATNGIWLCQTHAHEIDADPARYTVTTLHGWKQHAEEHARLLLGRPITGHTLEAAMEVSLQRSNDGALLIVGHSNLPSGAKIWTTLHHRTIRPLGITTKTSVYSRQFASDPMFYENVAIPQDWYRVSLLSYFNGPWKQPQSVIDIVGSNGLYLAGQYADPVDPDVDDTHTRLRADFECVAPPLPGSAPMTEEELDSACEELQALRLESIQGGEASVSARSVGHVIKSFLESPGLSVHEGWSSRELMPGVAEISFSFWNGTQPAQAVWHVIPGRGARYRNRHAKYMSWAPDY